MKDAALDFPTLDGAAITATADMGDLDLGYSDIGSGKPLYFNVACSVTGTSTAEAQFRLRTAAATAGLAAGDIILESPVKEFVDHISGQMIYSAALPSGLVLGRVRAQVVVTNGPGTVLQVNAWIGSQPQNGLGIRTPIAPSS